MSSSVAAAVQPLPVNTAAPAQADNASAALPDAKRTRARRQGQSKELESAVHNRDKSVSASSGWPAFQAKAALVARSHISLVVAVAAVDGALALPTSAPPNASCNSVRSFADSCGVAIAFAAAACASSHWPSASSAKAFTTMASACPGSKVRAASAPASASTCLPSPSRSRARMVGQSADSRSMLISLSNTSKASAVRPSRVARAAAAARVQTSLPSTAAIAGL
mmetsp:Transcript_54437/g.151647  ORF Transcript_54437/g.151647 Transcript_54437/m.151647 type:complete len:224 (+) Transcript_54437:2483-3154(+)